MTRGRFAAALPLLLLPWFLGALPRPALAQVKGKTDLDKLVSAARLSPVVLLDTSGVGADIYRVRSTPTAYLIGRDHKLVGRVQGTRGWDERPTRELIDYLLKAPAR